MITAVRAYEKTKHNFEINLLKDNIENGINKAIEKGEYTCTMNIGADTKQFVRDELAKWLIGLGYTCTISKYKSYKSQSCLLNLMDNQDEIYISWESVNIIKER